VALQSLVMMNDAFIAQQAEQLALRVEAGNAPSDERKIEMLFRFVLGRRPDQSETTTCRELLRQQRETCQAAGIAAGTAARQALVQLCHTLLNTSEFLYVE
jgi:hypothetical protein